MIEQLFPKYMVKTVCGYYVPECNIPDLVSDVLSSQWQTREPTREDATEILVEYYDGTYMVVEVLYWSEMGRNFKRWMKIPD